MDSDIGDAGQSIPEIVVRAPQLGGLGRSGMNPFGSGFGMDFSNFGQGITNVGAMNYGAGFNPGASMNFNNLLQPKKPEKPEPPPETKEKDERSWREKKAAGEYPILAWFRDKAGEIGEAIKEHGWDFVKNALLFNPQTRPVVLAIDAFKAFQEGGPGGIMGALGQTAMQKVFGPNLDVAKGIYGAASGRMTPGQALGSVAISRGMRAGIQGLMKNIYGQWGMNGVRLAMPLLQTALQARGQGPGGP
jgi:hypothetical protein